MNIPSYLIRFLKQFPVISIDTGKGSPVSILHNKNSPSTSILAAIKDGVEYESQELWGISHFIEHILFRGTENIPTLYQLSRRMEGIGGMISAYSTRDMTAFWIKTFPGYEVESFQVLEELLARPALDPKFIEKEKAIIHQERLREINNPGFYNSLVIESLLLEPNPISRHPVGDDRIIEAMEPEMLRNYLKGVYHRDNIFMGIAGNISNDLIPFLDRFLDSLPTGQKREPAKFILESSGEGPVYHLPSHHQSQVFLSLGWKFPVMSEEEVFAWRVLNSLLGAGYTSLFNVSLREQENITYLCSTGLNIYRDTGVFKLNMALDVKNVGKAIEKIDDIIHDVGKGMVADDIFREAVVKHASNLIFRMEDSLEVAKILGHTLLREGRAFNFANYLADLDKVTKEEIARLAAQFLKPDERKILLQTGSPEINRFFDKITPLKK